ncbi:hypothetical protein Pst134EA_000353 [Puccinia striiformis f. sp. tritici]|uniref:hypothetical protein n=1 Tax=Puccinia striiformis f. sp. tritici TaxID=168172 RepID=UPI002008D4C7|nr:hypothetical protein Pst134EA_000353 [Puccinia striiformis f. sp. tritici]KAH9473279.1 hypothetical protein Pst134EA_000353 [Puccinia striiformis f. sp. tritici]
MPSYAFMLVLLLSLVGVIRSGSTCKQTYDFVCENTVASSSDPAKITEKDGSFSCRRGDPNCCRFNEVKKIPECVDPTPKKTNK